MPIDEELEAPVIKVKNGENYEYICESFVTQGTKSTVEDEEIMSGESLVINDYNERLYKYKNENDSISKNAYAGICPDFLLN
jgi:hypothetical protein